MPRLNKYICSGFTAILMGLTPAMSVDALDSDTITVFAGPQSLSPNETISVTVQTPRRIGEFSGAEQVELTYTDDGALKTLVGNAIHGLLSFDVPAQDRVGIMKFSAKALGQTSSEALVKIVSGPPQKLSLQIRASHEESMIVISSGKITDTGGNTVSDQSLMDIQWVAEAGLVKSQNAQLLNGKLYLEAKCPRNFSGELKIRALLKTVQFLSSDISSLCIKARG